MVCQVHQPDGGVIAGAERRFDRDEQVAAGVQADPPANRDRRRGGDR
jgi:hypothetical protein